MALIRVFFSSHDKDTRGPLEPDSVPFAVLFWLCMGCVTLLDGRVFRRLEGTPRGAIQIGCNAPTTVQSVNVAKRNRFQIIEASTPRSRIISWAEMLLGKIARALVDVRV